MRVIAGVARGRRLKALPDPNVRPTGDKVKGAIFSMLEALALRLGYDSEEGPDGEPLFAAALAWPRVLDLYAGAGALGIEALSRGATSVDFVEAKAAARRLIHSNLTDTRLERGAAIKSLSAEQATASLAGPYDLVLADPPYFDPAAAGILKALAGSKLLSEQAVLVWEHHRTTEPPARLGKLVLRRSVRHGVAVVSLYTGAAGEHEAVATAVDS